MRIIAERVLGKQLKSGDLFSTAGQDYWDLVPGWGAIGERVYIRTDEPCPPSEEDEEIYRVTIRR